MGGAVVGDDAAQIAAQPGNGKVVANVENGELLGKFAAVGGGEHPLREVVGKTLGEEVMRSEGLIGVMEDGGVAAVLETRKKFSERAGNLIADARDVSDGIEIERGFGGFHGKAASRRRSAPATSSGSRTRYRARVGSGGPTRTEMPRRRAANAGSSE